jgi:hypothetical protein
MTTTQLQLMLPGTDVRHGKERLFNLASGELWMLIAQFCDIGDYGRLAQVSAQAKSGCKRYVQLYVRLPPGWTLQRMGEEARWLNRALHITTPQTTLAGLTRWMQMTATQSRLFDEALATAYHEARNRHELSGECLFCCGSLCFCGVGMVAMTSFWGYIATWIAAVSCPIGLHGCCVARADAEWNEVAHRAAAFQATWRVIVTPQPRSYGTMTGSSSVASDSDSD